MLQYATQQSHNLWQKSLGHQNKAKSLVHSKANHYIALIVKRSMWSEHLHIKTLQHSGRQPLCNNPSAACDNQDLFGIDSMTPVSGTAFENLTSPGTQFNEL